MGRTVNHNRRPYHAPRRAAGAARTREDILIAAKASFETRGWTATTVSGIAAAADVSPKTIEALFGTKAGLLATVVDYSIRGDTGDVPLVRRETARAIERAPDAATMLDLHAAISTAVYARSARLAWVVETAAPGHERLRELWTRMTDNRQLGVQWAARTLMPKPGVRADLTLREAEEIFLVAMDWGTYRTLTTEGGLTTEAVRDWIKSYYRLMLVG